MWTPFFFFNLLELPHFDLEIATSNEGSDYEWQSKEAVGESYISVVCGHPSAEVYDAAASTPIL